MDFEQTIFRVRKKLIFSTLLTWHRKNAGLLNDVTFEQTIEQLEKITNFAEKQLLNFF